MDPLWETSLTRTGKMNEMKAQLPEVEEGKVPDVKGLGLKDALYVLENAGYVCSYSGYGHVDSYTVDGKNITLKLK
jgi:cell division protein FtsI (penicillin-binding protein 3)